MKSAEDIKERISELHDIISDAKQDMRKYNLQEEETEEKFYERVEEIIEKSQNEIETLKWVLD